MRKLMRRHYNDLDSGGCLIVSRYKGMIGDGDGDDDDRDEHDESNSILLVKR